MGAPSGDAEWEQAVAVPLALRLKGKVLSLRTYPEAPFASARTKRACRPCIAGMGQSHFATGFARFRSTVFPADTIPWMRLD